MFKQSHYSRSQQNITQVPDISVGWHIFCDGACEPNPGTGGWGVVVYRDGQEIAAVSGGHLETTNNVMELTGMLEAAQWLIDHLKKDQPATVWCDSQYVVNGCNSWRHKWKRNGWSRKGPAATKPETGAVKNLELWKTIDEALNKCPRLTVAWCKGHAGIEGNERADALSLIGRLKAIEAAALADPVDAINQPIGHDHAHLERLACDLTDNGKIIEAGWMGLRLAAIPLDAPAVQLEEMRGAFFAGAHHLFSSMMAIMDADAEPTEADLRRMSLINDELQSFYQMFQLKHLPTHGRA